MKACTVCGARAYNNTRCPKHIQAPHSHSRTYQRNAKVAVTAATKCWLCGLPATPDDPFTADHVQPRSAGGTDDLANLRPAHRSCNSRRGAAITNAA